MLKADASVDLVHFTILRPPKKQDGTPTKELSLIAFPTRELFLEKLDQFDLVIFDRYQRQSILPDSYLANVADYVRKGGRCWSRPARTSRAAMASPRRRSPTCWRRSRRVRWTQEPFKPQVTLLGERIPLSRALPGDAPTEPKWGRWFRLIDTSTQNNAQELMSGPGNSRSLPLPVSTMARGAVPLGSGVALGARFEGGGPQLELLRRISHWLIRSPTSRKKRFAPIRTAATSWLNVRRWADAAQPVEVTPRPGKVLAGAAAGRPSRCVHHNHRGGGDRPLRSQAGNAHSLCRDRHGRPEEFADVRASASLMQPVASRRVAASLAGGRPAALQQGECGRLGEWLRLWMALTDNQQFRVLAVRETPLFSTLLSLAVLLAVSPSCGTARAASWRSPSCVPGSGLPDRQAPWAAESDPARSSRTGTVWIDRPGSSSCPSGTFMKPTRA